MMAVRDIKVLSLLLLKEKTSPYKSILFDEILSEYITNSKATISKSSIRRSLDALMKNELIGYGYQRANRKTYYINENGVNFLGEVK